MTEHILSALKKCELFEGIEQEELKALITCIKPRIQNYERNDFVVRNGDSLDSLGIVIAGEASVFKESLSGNKIFMKNLGVGEMFGEIAVFARQKEWPALVQANTPLTVCFMPQDRIVGSCENLCNWHRIMTTNMLRAVSERALILSKKMEYVSIKTMRAKLCTFIYEHYLKEGTFSKETFHTPRPVKEGTFSKETFHKPRPVKKGATTFLLPMNRGQLADFLNVSRPSMSRELSRMRDEGIIDYHMSTVKILDLEALKSYCE